MFGGDLAIRGRSVVTPEGVRAGCIHVSAGSIDRVAAYDDVPEGVRLVEVGDAAILPGLVDTHVHVNEPGRTEWEGFESATRAAAAGGVTGIVDMPLNSIPPTTSVAALQEKRAAAAGKVQVDVGFWGGAVPDALGTLRELHDEGVFGFKAFLCASGVDEFPPLDLDRLVVAMKEIAAFDGLLIVHAELPDELLEDPSGDRNAHATHLASRPPEAERRAIEAVVEASEETGCRAHVLHLSDASSLDLLDDTDRVTAETCPHYLTFEAEEIGDGETAFKCSPPIRGAANRVGLWDALRDGRITAVVSDHSPCSPELKAGSFFEAWGGIASVELGLRAVWTQARARGHSLGDVARWMCTGPATLAGIERKGAIAPGKDADLVVFDPDDAAEVDPVELHHRNPVTPYAGRRLDGRVLATYVRGVEAYAEGRFPNEHAGLLLRRGEA
jgi:allantoinase